MLITLGSCNQDCYKKQPDLYYIHHTALSGGNRSFLCNPKIVNQVNTSWLKHGTYNCHYYNSFIQTFPEKFGECVKRVTKPDIIDLLGEPNEDVNQTLKYYTSRNCQKNMLNYGLLSFTYDKDSNVDFTFMRTKVN